MTDRTVWAEGVVAAVRSAHRVVLHVYESEIAVSRKADDSPVTKADRRAEAVLVTALKRLAPGVPVIAEEAMSALAPGTVVDPGERFWLVDPLDGTREFIARNGEFTVNVALIEHGEPVLGVVGAPALGRYYLGMPGIGAWVEDADGRRPIACREVPAEGLTVVASRSHGDEAALAAYLRGWPVATRRSVGSSLKLCIIASGEADLYPRFGRTMAWDIAAGHAVVEAAGGSVVDLDGVPLRYGVAPGAGDQGETQAFENPAFVVHGR